VPIAERLGSVTGIDPCEVAARWGISDELAERLTAGADRLEFPLAIISGLRSVQEQLALGQRGRPTAPIDLSTHLACPATGADVMPQIAVTDIVKARLGTEMVFAGLRWGGGSPVTPVGQPGAGIPSDWNHFDLGPRR